jgi:hypothetical protein
VRRGDDVALLVDDEPRADAEDCEVWTEMSTTPDEVLA